MFRVTSLFPAKSRLTNVFISVASLWSEDFPKCVQCFSFWVLTSHTESFCCWPIERWRPGNCICVSFISAYLILTSDWTFDLIWKFLYSAFAERTNKCWVVPTNVGSYQSKRQKLKHEIPSNLFWRRLIHFKSFFIQFQIFDALKYRISEGKIKFTQR